MHGNERIAKIYADSLPHRVDPFSKKDWYDVKAPSMFNQRNVGKTLVTRTQGTSKNERNGSRAIEKSFRVR